MERVTTSRELAELAGVSHMTVSRVFRNDARVSEATRQKVLKTAREYGYRPNALVSLAMRARQKETPKQITGTLAWVHSNLTESSWRKAPHLMGVFQGAKKRAYELGFKLDEFWTREKGMTQRRLSDIMLNRGIRGAVIAPPPGVMKHMRLDWKEFAVSTFNHDGWRPLLHRVSIDSTHRISETWRQLIKLGYRRIGFAMPYHSDRVTDHAFTGRFLVAQQQVKAKERIPILAYMKHELRMSEKEFKQWLNKYKPDALIAQHFETVQMVEEVGWKVPDDMGVAHLNIGPDVPDWSGMVLNQFSIGRAAVDLVVNQLVRNEFGIPEEPREVVLRAKWQSGVTTRKQSG